MGMNIYGNYGIPNLSNVSKISHENEILSQEGARLCIDSHDKWFCIKSWQKFAKLLLCKAWLTEICRKHSSPKIYVESTVVLRFMSKAQ